MKNYQKADDVEKPVILIKQSETRWNSSYRMLTRYNQVRDYVDQVILSWTAKKRNKVLLTEEEKQTLLSVEKIFEPFDTAITIIEGEKYVTASLAVFVLEKLFDKIKKVKIDESDTTGTIVKEEIEASFKKRLGALPNCMLIAHALDPRFKFNSKQFPERTLLKLLKKELKNTFFEPEVAQSPIKKKRKVTALEHFANDEKEEQEEQDEIEKFKSLPTVPLPTDPLEWWSNHHQEFPNLAMLAKRFLAISASSAPSERAWSTGGNIYTKKRSKLSPDLASKLIFLHQNIKEEVPEDLSIFFS